MSKQELKKAVKSQLKLVKNDLVPVFETGDGMLEVSGRDLHQKLGVKKDYTDWVKDQIQRLELVESTDFTFIPPKSGKFGEGKTKSEYHFPIDIAKEIAMISQTKMGKVVRRYFIEIEREYRQALINDPSIGRSQLEVLQLIHNHHEIVYGILNIA